MDRKLYQINWQRGQTDGDQVQGSVGLLKNARAESPGKLGPRPVLDLVDGPFGTEYATHVRVKGDPMDIGATHWDLFFDSTSFMAKSSTGTVQTVNWIPTVDSNIDVEKSSFSSTEFGAVCSLWSTAGAFLGVHFIKVARVVNGLQVLPPAKFIEGTSYEPGEQGTAGDPVWMVVKPTTTRPEIGVFYEEMSGAMGYVGEMTDGQCPSVDAFAAGETNENIPWNDVAGKIQRLRNDAASFIGSDHNKIAIIASKMVDAAGIFGKSFSVKIVAQYVFDDGTVSMPSEAVNINASAYWPQDTMTQDGVNYSLLLSVMRNMNADASIKSIRIFRKIIDPGNDLESSEDYDLIMTIPMGEDEDEPLSREVSAAVEEYDLPGGEGYSGDQYDHLEFLDAPYGMFTSVGGWDPFDLLGAPGGGMVREADETWISKGWCRMSPSSEVCIYFDEHYYSLGKVGFRQSYYQLKFSRYGYTDAKFLHSTKTGAVLNSVVQGGHPWLGLYLDAPISYDGGDFFDGDIAFGIYSLYSDHPSYVTALSDPNNIFCMAGAVAYFDDSVFLDEAYYQSGVNSYSDYHPSTPETWRIPMVYTVDPGLPSVDTLDTSLGVNTDDVIYPTIKHIRRIGGRLFGLNVAYGDSVYQSRLLYTPHARALFSQNNFFDYSRASEGAGLGLLTWNSFLCCFYEDSVGIMDISGGTDFAFREVAFTEGVAPYNKRAFCSSPAGVFWAGEHINVFDGKSIGNVSEMRGSGISILDTYRDMVTDPSLVRCNYYEEDEEVWITHGNKAMVLSIRSMSWKYYELDELEEDAKIISSVSDNTGDYIFVYSAATGLVKYSVNKRWGGQIPFEWGVEFDASLQAPEIVKKSKRLYVTVEGSNAQVRVQADGDFGQQIVRESQIEMGDTGRYSTSMRGRVPRFSVMVTGGSTWQTRIDSIGLSYKLKSIK